MLCAGSPSNACDKVSKIRQDSNNARQHKQKNVDRLNIIYENIFYTKYIYYLRFFCVCRLALFLSRYILLTSPQVFEKGLAQSLVLWTSFV